METAKGGKGLKITDFWLFRGKCLSGNVLTVLSERTESGVQEGVSSRGNQAVLLILNPTSFPNLPRRRQKKQHGLLCKREPGLAVPQTEPHPQASCAGRTVTQTEPGAGEQA